MSDVARVLAEHQLVWLINSEGVEVAARCASPRCEFSTDILDGAQERHLTAVVEAEVIRSREAAAWAEGAQAGLDAGLCVGEATVGLRAGYPPAPENPYLEKESER